MAVGLRREDKTFLLRKHIFDVRNELGAGWSEFIYHEALVRSLSAAGIPVESTPRYTLVHRGVDIHLFVPDLIVWDQIVLELKVLPYQEGFAGEHTAQLLHYLKFLGLDLGLLVNFAPLKVKIQRLVWQEPALAVAEEIHHADGPLPGETLAGIDDLRGALLAVTEQHGLGYPDGIYRRLLEVELGARGFAYQTDVVIPARWKQGTLANHQTTCLLIENAYLLFVTALSARPSGYDFARMKTYLKSLGLRFGIIANFGYRQLQIYDVSS